MCVRISAKISNTSLPLKMSVKWSSTTITDITSQAELTFQNTANRNAEDSIIITFLMASNLHLGS